MINYRELCDDCAELGSLADSAQVCEDPVQLAIGPIVQIRKQMRKWHRAELYKCSPIEMQFLSSCKVSKELPELFKNTRTQLFGLVMAAICL